MALYNTIEFFISLQQHQMNEFSKNILWIVLYTRAC